jgi:hypothetical protein
MHEDDRDARPNTSDQLSQPERRRNAAAPEETVPVRLVRKYADMIDGVNLAHTIVGDRLWLTPRDASILIAEGWAEPADNERRGRTTPQRALAADTTPGSRRKPKP